MGWQSRIGIFQYMYMKNYYGLCVAYGGVGYPL